MSELERKKSTAREIPPPSSASCDVGSTAKRLTALPPLAYRGQLIPNSDATMDSLPASRMQAQMMQYTLPSNHGIASHSNHGFAPIANAVMLSTSCSTVGPSLVHAATVPPSYAGLESWFYQPQEAGSVSQIVSNEYNMHSQYCSVPPDIDSKTANPNTATGSNLIPTSLARSNSAIADDHNSLPYPQYYAMMAAAAATTVAQQQHTANDCNTQTMEVVSTTDVPPNILVIDPRKKRKAKKEKPPPLRSPSGTIIKRPRGRPRSLKSTIVAERRSERDILVLNWREKNAMRKENLKPPLRSPSGTIIKRPRGRPRMHPRPDESATPAELLSRMSEEQMENQLREHERDEQRLQGQISANVATVNQEPIVPCTLGIDMMGGISMNRQGYGGNLHFIPHQAPNRMSTPSVETNGNKKEGGVKKTRVKLPRLKAGDDLSCVNCGTRNTTLWRRNENGVVECNACSLYFRKNNRSRPMALVKDQIIRRNRVGGETLSPSAAYRLKQREIMEQREMTQKREKMELRQQEVPSTNVVVDGIPEIRMVGAQQVHFGTAQLQQEPQVGAVAQYVNYLMANRQDLLGLALQQQQQQLLSMPKAGRSLSGIRAPTLTKATTHTPQGHYLQTHFERYGQDVSCSYVVPNTAGMVQSSSTSALPSYCQMASLPQLMPGLGFIDARPSSI